MAASMHSGAATVNSYRFALAGNRRWGQIDTSVSGFTSNNLSQLTGQSPGGPMEFADTGDKRATITLAGRTATVEASGTWRETPDVTSGANAIPLVATDVNGNTTTKTINITVSGGASRTLIYDLDGELLNNGAGKIYAYDATNQLVSITLRSNVTAFGCNGLGQRVRGELIRSVIKPWKVFGPDLNGRFGGLQGTGGLEAVILDADGTATGVINDQFGNGVATVSGTGSGASVTWNTTRVGAYGPLPGIQAQTLTDVSQVAAATAWRSRRIDSTGFYWLGARYYEPTSGRFLSCDPLGHAASRSLYDFCNGDPVNFFDPDGRIFGTGLGFGEFFGSVGSGMAQGAGNYFVGLGQGMVGAVNGAQNAILHPVTTFENAANGLGTLAGNLRYNTSDTLSGIGNTITNTVTDSGKLGNAIGNAVGAVAFGELAAGVTEALNGGSELVGQSFGKVGTAVEDPGLSITGFTDHGFMRANTRGLSWDTMADTVADPTVVLQQSGGAYLFLTDDAGVALSSDGMIITTYSPPFYPHIQAILDASAAAEDTIALAQAGTVTGALTIEMTTPSKRCPLSN